MSETTLDELYSILYELMLSDYEFSRNYRNFLEVSRNYFTSSGANNRNIHSTLNRIMTLEDNLARNTEHRRNGFTNHYTSINSDTNNTNNTSVNNNTNNTSVNNNISTRVNRSNRNIPVNAHTHDTTTGTSLWNSFLGNSNTHLTQSIGRQITNHPISNFTTLLSNTLLQNELLNSPLEPERERLPTEAEINNTCEVLLYRDCSSNNQTRCPIDMVDFEPEDSIMRITHCSHIFREANLRRNFQTSSTCPMCRHNIIQHHATTSRNRQTRENSNNSQSNQSRENDNNIINTIMNQILNNPNSLNGNENFLDASGNNISIEYSISSNFI